MDNTDIKKYIPDLPHCHNLMLMRMRSDINDAFAKLDRDFREYRERVQMLYTNDATDDIITKES